jgi:hypothetical protein
MLALKTGVVSSVSIRSLRGVHPILCIVALLLSFVANGNSASAQDRVPPDPRFGAVEAHDAPDQATMLGIGWGRARFHWAWIQPNGPDQWIDAELTPDEVSREQEDGREIVGLLIGVPEWARDDEGLPRGLDLPPNDPDNFWAGFVREAVTRYRGVVDHWIIWNEPDVWDADHPGYTWSGTEADYVQLLKVAYLVAKEVNPDTVMHLTAVSHWWDALYGRELYFERLIDALVAEPDAADHHYYFDVATLHLYFNPVSSYEVIDQYTQIQRDHGLDKPIWLVETNAAPSTDPSWPVPDPTFRVSLLEQAAYMPQALVLASAAGAERIAIYKLIDTAGDISANPEPFGLVRSDGSARPVFQTTRVAIEQLSGAETITWTDQHLAAQVVIEHVDSVTRMFWSRVPAAQQVRVPALTDHAVLIDMWGTETLISPNQGTYTIILYGGECQQTTGDYCMIGGPPVYLVEAGASTVDLPTLTLDSSPPESAEHVRASGALLSLPLWIGFSSTIVILVVGLIFRNRSLHRS